jgi:hypothetical protein
MLSELRAFQTNLRALEGHHDDWVMMLAIAMHALPLASPMVHRPQVVLRAPSDHNPDCIGQQSPVDLIYGAAENFRDSCLA